MRKAAKPRKSPKSSEFTATGSSSGVDSSVAKRVPRIERERQMLEVAAQLFGEKGYEATSMDDIAHACGITKPMLYAYFDSKDGLYSTMINRAGIRLMTEFAAALVPGDSRQSIANTTVAFLNFVEKFQGSWRMVFSSPPQKGEEMSTIMTYRQQIMRSLAFLLAELKQGGSPTRADIDAMEPYAACWLGSCESMAQWWLADPTRTKADVQRTLNALLPAWLAAV